MNKREMKLRIKFLEERVKKLERPQPRWPTCDKIVPYWLGGQSDWPDEYSFDVVGNVR